MEATGSEPVIVGCGLSGMVISDRLSRANVPHVLVGDPPGDQPRLGESLDPAGTLQLLEWYPDLDDFYYNKRWITVFGGDYALSCNFSQKLVRRVALRMLGYESPPQFLHVDRVGFDRALYDRVAASDHCTRVEAHVDDVDYDADADAVERLHLDGGETMEPSYVFDCTNQARVLGRAIDLPVEWLGEPQRVVFTHYHAPEGTDASRLGDEEWEHSTNLLRLYDEMDGLDGLAWLIPLGSYVSVGISMPRDQETPDAGEVLARVAEAYAHRGMDFLEIFGESKEPVDVPRQQYFYHERAYGGNWLLAGPAYGQVWFPSASGVGTSLVAAGRAPQVLDDPEGAGRRYQEYVDGLRETHHVFDRMITHEYEAMTEELVRTESARIIAENVKRVARLAAMQKGPFATGIARLLLKTVDYEGVAEGDCDVYEADMPRQTRLAFEHE